MSGRIKILLAVLAVSTGLSLWYATNLFGSGSPSDRSAGIFQQTTPTPEKDTDNDGLPDTEETYWKTDFNNPDTDGDGFKDGEEVLSGHNPTKAGPDDLLDNKANLTARASTLLLGGLVTGDLDPSSPTYEASIAALIDQIFEQYNANVSVELDSIVVSLNDSDEIFRYGLAMSRILKALFTDAATGFGAVIATVQHIPISELSALHENAPEQYAQFIAAIDSQIAMLDKKANEIKSIKPPASMLPAHRNALIFVRGAQQQYRALRAIDRDPLQGIISMQMLSALTSTTAGTITTDFSSRLTKALTP